MNRDFNMALPIRKADVATKAKEVEGNQKSIDALPLDSGSGFVRPLPSHVEMLHAATPDRRRPCEGDFGSVTVKAAKEEAKKK
jgi:hypothetical protein